MKYIFVGMLLNSLVTSTHDNEEACKGREAMLKEKGIVGQCAKEHNNSLMLGSGTYCIKPNGFAGAC